MIVIYHRILLGTEQQIGGPVPTTLGDLQSLVALNLADNAFTGPLPTELGRLALLTQLLAGGNKLNGTVPPSILKLPDLKGL